MEYNWLLVGWNFRCTVGIQLGETASIILIVDTWWPNEGVSRGSEEGSC